MSMIPPPDLNIRSYGAGGGAHRHEFAQLVLPIAGSINLEIGGRRAKLAAGAAAFVGPGVPHSQWSRTSNRSLVIDVDGGRLGAATVDRLATCPFMPLGAPAARLADFMTLSLRSGATPRVDLWVPLLIETIAGRPMQPPSRLDALIAAIEADPARPWTTAGMASDAGVSVSRLHVLFREQVGSTPHAFVADLRLKRVQAGLAATNRSIAELAYRAGFSDQSALTRALRKATGLTPAAYRRQFPEIRPKTR
jgi:AraC-like DNA-binding protein